MKKIALAIHDARIIPLDGRPHSGPAIRNWLGDSRGHWEGDTLVVDTTNFSRRSNFRGAHENLHMVERFTRTSPDRLEYTFTVSDDMTWVRPWTVMIPLQRSTQPNLRVCVSRGQPRACRHPRRKPRGGEGRTADGSGRAPSN